MELIFLGTGAGVPSPERNVTGIALSLQEERGGFCCLTAGKERSIKSCTPRSN